ncbi:MAG: hypothetical protein ACTH1W_07305, partial [Advenella sp.]
MGILDAVNAVLGGGKKPEDQTQGEQRQDGQVASEQAPLDPQDGQGGLGSLGGLAGGINLGALGALLPVIMSV